MALIQYDPLVAYDAMSGELLVTATGTIHALDDVDALTPLPVTDLAGVPLAGAQVPVVRGLTTGFRVEDAQRVMWVSGEHRITLWSPTGLQAAAEAAAASATSSPVSVTGQVDRAEQAALRAEAAAGQASAVTDAAVAEVLSVPTSATVTALYALGLGLSASETAPTDPGEGEVWWDSTTGRLMRYDATYLEDWAPVGEPPPTTAYQGLGLGRATITGSQGVAVGTEAVCSTTQGVAIGFQASAADGYAAVALGSSASATGAQSIALSAQAVASDSSSVAIGTMASASAVNALAVGTSAATSGQGSQAIGELSSAAGPFSTALGSNARVSPTGSSGLAAGRNAYVVDSEGVALGSSAGVGADASRGVALGASSTALGMDSVAVGASANASSGASTVAIGPSSLTWDDRAVALGMDAQGTSADAVALGPSTRAQNPRAIAIGAGATTGGDDEAVIAAASLEVAPHPDAATDASTLVLRSPDGTRWRIAVDDAGVLSTTEIL